MLRIGEYWGNIKKGGATSPWHPGMAWVCTRGAYPLNHRWGCHPRPGPFPHARGPMDCSLKHIFLDTMTT